jgi:hypothetical protein
MAAVPQAKSKPYHWLCLGTWRRQHLTLEKSTYQYLIMILLFYVLSIWWNIMEVIWNLFFFTSFYDSSILLCISLSGLIHVFDVSCERIEFALFCSIVS